MSNTEQAMHNNKRMKQRHILTFERCNDDDDATVEVLLIDQADYLIVEKMIGACCCFEESLGDGGHNIIDFINREQKYAFVLVRTDRPGGRVVHLKHTGAVPNSLYDLTALKSLLLQTGNSRHDGDDGSPSLNSEISRLVSLEELTVEAGSCTVWLPSEIGELRNLKKLVIRHNTFNLLPPEIGKLERLEELILYNCRCLVGLPDETRALRSLQTLDIRSCPAIPSLPECIWSLANLTSFSFSIGEFPDLQVTRIGELSNLRELNLGNVGHSSSSPDVVSFDPLGSLLKLTLTLTASHLLFFPPAVFDSCQELRVMKVHWDLDAETLTSRTFETLAKLKLSVNRLTIEVGVDEKTNQFPSWGFLRWPVATTFCNLTELKIMGDSQFSVPLLTVVGGLTKLRSLDISHNRWLNDATQDASLSQVADASLSLPELRDISLSLVDRTLFDDKNMVSYVFLAKLDLPMLQSATFHIGYGIFDVEIEDLCNILLKRCLKLKSLCLTGGVCNISKGVIEVLKSLPIRRVDLSETSLMRDIGSFGEINKATAHLLPLVLHCDMLGYLGSLEYPEKAKGSDHLGYVMSMNRVRSLLQQWECPPVALWPLILEDPTKAFREKSYGRSHPWHGLSDGAQATFHLLRQRGAQEIWIPRAP
jgi:Leucine-rich repeat (LRR) protein